uniref:Transmembrane p24 trafficking protein 5 n=2 Tax=Rattus norvegicus TaxID=10116 RepID=A0A0H2UH88_RAT
MGVRMWLPFPMLLLSALPATLLSGAAGFTPSLDSDFTFTLPAGQKECFYQPMPLKASLEIEYQVLDGGELDIDFHLASPEGRTLVFEQRKSDGVHTVETEDGDYMFCFDNTFSTISEKVIFFELILDNMGEEVEGQEDWKKYITNTDVLEMKLEDILESINSIKSRLSKSGHIQTLLRAFEARDRNIQESNFDRVNFWSVVNLMVMVVVSAIQVYTLKSLFEDKRKIVDGSKLDQIVVVDVHTDAEVEASVASVDLEVPELRKVSVLGIPDDDHGMHLLDFKAWVVSVWCPWETSLITPAHIEVYKPSTN